MSATLRKNRKFRTLFLVLKYLLLFFNCFLFWGVFFFFYSVERIYVEFYCFLVINSVEFFVAVFSVSPSYVVLFGLCSVWYFRFRFFLLCWIFSPLCSVFAFLLFFFCFWCLVFVVWTPLDGIALLQSFCLCCCLFSSHLTIISISFYGGWWKRERWFRVWVAHERDV